ncbi:MAG: YfhO family protein [Candidatus Omnitrophica bacterium]|nr:YfhO family protein [Candidatus Omnitrophota bacterium]
MVKVPWYKRKIVVIISFLIACIGIYFFRALFAGGMYLSGDLFYYYGMRVLAAADLSQGIFPLWTPTLNCGFPLAANPEAGLFDPLNILLLAFFSPPTAFILLLCAYFLIAGIGMVLLCRALGLDDLSSFCAAIVYIFGGAFSGRQVHAPMIFSAAFLPFTFLAITYFYKTLQIRYVFLAGIAIGASFLPGHPQIAIYSALFAGIYFAWNLFLRDTTKISFKYIVRHVLLLCVIYAVGIGIGAVQIIPSAEFTRFSTRAGYVPFQAARAISFYFQNFIAYVYPYFFGIDPIVGKGISYWGKGNFWELFVYIGIIPLCLVIASLTGMRRQKQIKTFFWLFIIAISLALGKNGPLFFLAYHLIPALRYFMNPCRFVFISSFALAVLSGFGLKLLTQDDAVLKKTLRIVVIGGALIGMGVALFARPQSYGLLALPFWLAAILLLWLRARKRLSPKALSLSLIALSFVDLYGVGTIHNVPVDRSAVRSSAPSIAFLKKDTDTFRVFNVGTDFPYGAISHKEVRKIPFYSFWGIQSANMAGPLYLSPYSFLFDIKEERGAPAIDAHLERLGFLNVKYITASVPLSSTALKPVFRDDTVTVYRNPVYEDRLYFISSPRVLTSPQTLQQQLWGGVEVLRGYLARHKIIASERDVHDVEDKARIDIVEQKSNRLMLKVDTSRNGFILVNETAYPGWKVFVDGRQEELLSPHFSLRAVFIPEGEHEVSFIYSPASVKIGLGLTIFSLSLALGCFFLPFFKKKIP